MKVSSLTKKASWVSLGDVVFKAMSFAISIYLARMLGAEQYGWVTVGFSILGYAIWFTDLGLVQIGTRDAAKQIDERLHSFSSLFLSRFYLGLLVIIAGILILQLSDIAPAKRQFYQLLLWASLPHALFLEWLYTGRQQFDLSTIARNLQNIIYLGVLLLLFQGAVGAYRVAAAYICGISVASLYLIVKLNRKHALVTPLPSFTNIVLTIKDGLRIGTGNIMTRMVILLPPICVGFFIGDAEAGLYGVAFKLVMGAMALDYMFYTLYLPVLTAATSRHSGRELADKLTPLTRIMTFMAVLLGFYLFALAPVAIIWIYGAAFSASVEILQILCWFATFALIGSVFTFGLIAIGKDRAYFRSAMWSGFLSIGLIVLAAQFGGLIWVAWAVTISECIIMCIRFYEFHRIIPLTIFQPLATAFLVIGCVQLFSFYFFSNILYLTIVGTVLITMTFVLSRSICLEDIYWLKNRVLQ